MWDVAATHAFEEYGELMIMHHFRCGLLIFRIRVILGQCILLVILRCPFQLVIMASVANPSRVDIACTQFAQKLSLKLRFKFSVAFVTETHGILVCTCQLDVSPSMHMPFLPRSATGSSNGGAVQDNQVLVAPEESIDTPGVN